MKNICVSIITVCFNSEKTIERTIKSVLNQTYNNLEYIIVDGKSTDNTLKIVEKYRPLFRGKMKVISEPDNGIYDAMNKGILNSSGELIGIINSDDYYEKDTVENVVCEMNDCDYQIIYGKLRVINEKSGTKIIMPKHENLSNEMIAHPTCFVTKKVYLDYGGFDTNYRSCADHDFMLRMQQYSDVIFLPVEKVLANFTEGTGVSAQEASILEALGMLSNHRIISKRKYWLILFKFKIKELLRNYLK